MSATKITLAKKKNNLANGRLIDVNEKGSFQWKSLINHNEHKHKIVQEAYKSILP